MIPIVALVTLLPYRRIPSQTARVTHDREMLLEGTWTERGLRDLPVPLSIRIALKEVASMILLAILVRWCLQQMCSRLGLVHFRQNCRISWPSTMFFHDIGLLARNLRLSFLPSLPSAECRSHDLGFPSSPAAVRRHGIWKEVATSSHCLSKALLYGFGLYYFVWNFIVKN